MNARDEMSAATAGMAALSDDLLTMDVADTIRRTPELAAAPGPLADLLRAGYRQQGLDVPDAVLAEGIAAAADNRFVYAPPAGGFGLMLAKLYIGRRTWRPVAVAIGLILIVGLGGYYFAYQPLRLAQIEQSRVELAETMPAQMDALYQSIFDITKVQKASNDAADIRDRGKIAAKVGDRSGAEAAVTQLTAIRDTLQQEYQLKIVDRPDSKWGFWTFPRVNSDATNYYIVVEALDANGSPESLPIRSEDTGRAEIATVWGLRVPEDVYRAIETDKADDGIIQHTLVGIKEFGFIDPDYLIQVQGGTVTRW